MDIIVKVKSHLSVSELLSLILQSLGWLNPVCLSLVLLSNSVLLKTEESKRTTRQQYYSIHASSDLVILLDDTLASVEGRG